MSTENADAVSGKPRYHLLVLGLAGSNSHSDQYITSTSAQSRSGLAMFLKGFCAAETSAVTHFRDDYGKPGPAETLKKNPVQAWLLDREERRIERVGVPEGNSPSLPVRWHLQERKTPFYDGPVFTDSAGSKAVIILTDDFAPVDILTGSALSYVLQIQNGIARDPLQTWNNFFTPPVAGGIWLSAFAEEDSYASANDVRRVSQDPAVIRRLLQDEHEGILSTCCLLDTPDLAAETLIASGFPHPKLIQMVLLSGDVSLARRILQEQPMLRDRRLALMAADIGRHIAETERTR